MSMIPERDLRTPAEWLLHPDYAGIEILDPDGWRQGRGDTTWNTPIPRHEFDVRLGISTIRITRDALKRLVKNDAI